MRARGQAGGYICRDTNALTRRSVLNTVRLDRLLRGLDIHANMHAPTGNQSADRQRTVHTHKQAQKEKFVWIGVQGFLFAEEYRVVVCWDAPAVSSCSHRNPDDSPFSSKHLECKKHHRPSGHPFSTKIKCFHQSCVCLCLPRLYLPRVIVNWLHCKIYSVRWRDLQKQRHTWGILRGYWECSSCRSNNDKW